MVILQLVFAESWIRTPILSARYCRCCGFSKILDIIGQLGAYLVCKFVDTLSTTLAPVNYYSLVSSTRAPLNLSHLAIRYIVLLPCISFFQNEGLSYSRYWSARRLRHCPGRQPRLWPYPCYCEQVTLDQRILIMLLTSYRLRRSTSLQRP